MKKSSTKFAARHCSEKKAQKNISGHPSAATAGIQRAQRELNPFQNIRRGEEGEAGNVRTGVYRASCIRTYFSRKRALVSEKDMLEKFIADKEKMLFEKWITPGVEVEKCFPRPEGEE